MDALTIHQCEEVSGGIAEVCFEASASNGVLVIGGIVMIMGLGGTFYAMGNSYRDAMACMALTSFAAGLVYVFR